MIDSKSDQLSDGTGSPISPNSAASILNAPSTLIENSAISKEKSKMLIICIDRDNDIGLKTGIGTPIVGREACLDSAMKLALADPEEADANTIFAAVKEYEELQSKGQDCEVVTVGGLFERGVMADKKIRGEIQRVLKGYPASEAVLVSDGVEGEELTPVINPLVQVVSIRKVVIKHSKSVEESYLVLGRYLRMLLFDPRYAKYALGIPGLIFIAVAIAYAANQTYAPLILVGLIGIVFAVRGFNVDREVSSIKNLTATGYMRLFAVIISVFIVVAGIILGIIPFYQTTPPSPAYLATQSTITIHGVVIPDLPKIFGYFIQNCELLVWLGMGVYVTSALFFNILRPKQRHVLRNVVALIVLALLYPSVYFLGKALVYGTYSTVVSVVGYGLLFLAVDFIIAAYIYSRLSRRSHRMSQDIEA